ncbi:uncharacterized protein LOC106640542 [Copidosoma floridanum]|uniref:uncharacterized protein LOC106640542 n=1 Tax=Copidosoma floridanum TaxID=29053 RepID=UPI000C6F7A42|nr:uncharacterized protein LOC106640542 [Copidosoma floridanum]
MFSPGWRLFLLLVLLLLLVVGEARRHEEPRHHRHRHRHEPSAESRWHRSTALRKRVEPEPQPRSHDEDDASDFDSYEYEEYTDEEEEDRGRLGRRAAQRWGRYEPSRHRSRYRVGQYSRAGYRYRGVPRHRPRVQGHPGWYWPSQRRYNSQNLVGGDDDASGSDEDSYHRYTGRPARKRPAAHPVNRRPNRRYTPESDEEEEEEDDDDYTYEEEDEDTMEEEEEEGDRSRRRLKGPSKWASSKLDEWTRLTRVVPDQLNESRSSYHEPSAKKGKDGFPEEDEYDDEEEVWRDVDGEDEGDNSLKTFDDIIRRLTGEREPTTTSATVARRGYRSSPESESYPKRDVYGNLKLFKTNGSRVVGAVRSEEAGSLVGGSKRKKSLGLEDRGDPAKWGGAEEAQLDIESDSIGDKSEEKKVTTTPTTVVSPTPSTTVAPSSTTTSTTSTSPRTTTTTTTTTSTKTSITPRPGGSSRKESPAYEAASTGSQYNGYQAKNDYPAMSAHSALKWQYLGTRESVTETRNNMPQFSKTGKSAEMHAAHSHALHVAKEGSCQWPRAKVVPVREVYPNSTATYIPHCAIVHRCSDDTGCCRSETLTCEAKQTHNVELYFYVTHIHGATAIEKLSFTNHTECECIERKDPRGSGSDEPMGRRPLRSHYPSSTVPQNAFNLTPPKKPCRCTAQFTPKITNNGLCECNCAEYDAPCIRIQQGKGFLSVNDRLCIRSEKCTMPNCIFGEYMISQGKCPRKKDIFEAVTNRRPVLNQYHHRRS